MVQAETIQRSLANSSTVGMASFQPAVQVLLLRMLLHFLITRLLCLMNFHTYLMSALQKTYMMSALQKVKETVKKAMLSKLFATMSDRSSVQKLLNEKLAAHCSDVLGTKTDIKLLYCNVHFLLGLSSCSEITLSTIEQQLQLANELGDKFGRDDVGKFSHFTSSQSCCARFIRTACNSFGPRPDENNGCRQHWAACCSKTQQVQSKINSF